MTPLRYNQSFRSTFAFLMTAACFAGLHPQSAHAGAAVFIKSDTTTKGNWKGIYGQDGYIVVKDASSNNPSDPNYAVVTPSGGTPSLISATSSDPAALEAALPASTTNVAADYTAPDKESVDVNITDGKPHKFALYMVDWGNLGRTQHVTVTDPVSKATLDTRDVSAFSGGVYLVWKLSGHVVVTITRTSTASAVLSGWFFDYPGAILTSVSVTPANLSVAAGHTAQYTATALDQDGNALSIQPSFTWAVTPGAGTISGGLLTAGAHTGGPFNVRATAGTVSGTTPFRVAATHTITFGTPISFNITGQSGPVVGDFDADGHMDVLTKAGGSLKFFYGDGQGHFTPGTWPYTNQSLGGGWVADVNKDGLPDLIFISGSNIVVVRNYVNRTFGNPVSYPASASINSVTLGDFDGNGYVDVAAAADPGVGNGSNNFAVVLNNRDGTFGAPKTYAIPGNYYGYAAGIVTADFNSDGKLDIVCSEEDELGAPSSSIYYGDGHGAFTLSSLGLQSVGGGALLTTDLNGDGLPDIATSDHWAGQPRWGLGDGKGGFPFQSTQGGAGYAGWMQAGDLDGDGFPDLLEDYSASTNELFYPNNGNGTFPEAARMTLSASGVMIGDFNEDGQPDVLVGSDPNHIYIYPNTTNPAPTITNLVPDGAAVGSSGTFQVLGHGFTTHSVVRWNNIPLPTTLDYKTGILTATITNADTVHAAADLITVVTSSPGGGTSNAAKFFVGNVPTSIQISPTTPTVNIGATQQFTATVFDQNHVAMPVQPALTWTTTGLGNTVSPTGLYSPGSIGSTSVYAIYDGLYSGAAVTNADFALTATPSTVTVSRGGHASSAIGLILVGGFAGNVHLSASGLPGGVVATFHPANISGSTKGTVTFTASPGATTGTVNVTITGIADGFPRTQTISLTVN